jgi:hypothetical protein
MWLGSRRLHSSNRHSDLSASALPFEFAGIIFAGNIFQTATSSQQGVTRAANN